MSGRQAKKRRRKAMEAFWGDSEAQVWVITHMSESEWRRAVRRIIETEARRSREPVSLL